MERASERARYPTNILEYSKYRTNIAEYYEYRTNILGYSKYRTNIRAISRAVREVSGADATSEALSFSKNNRRLNSNAKGIPFSYCHKKGDKAGGHNKCTDRRC